MSFRVIHILSHVDKINFGIWNAALFGSDHLRKKNIETITLICRKPTELPSTFPDIPVFFLDPGDLNRAIDLFVTERKITSSDIFVTHGCWLAPSRAGARLHAKGYKWVYVPHGMLEPWSMQNNALKKLVYYTLFEKRYALSATRIRAVGTSEQKNLAAKLGRPIDVIPNGIPEVSPAPKRNDVINFLFLGRLHFKKGILPLAKAWHKTMSAVPNIHLTIAGPDEGELSKITPYLGSNATYIGPVYGNDKAAVLQQSHYFLLPSLSEGFPVSVLEGMSYGLIPVISKGCNFDEVFDMNLGIQMEPEEQQVSKVLSDLAKKPFDPVLSKRNSDFARAGFSENTIGEQLVAFYTSIQTQ